MSKTNTLSIDEFKSIYSKVPRLTVEVILKTKDGIVLTLRKLPSWNNHWHIPGGTVLYGETLEQAIQRVAKDELGIKVKIVKLLGYISYPSEKKERGYGWSIGIAYLCKIKSGILRQNNQAKEIQIFKILPSNIINEQSTELRILAMARQVNITAKSNRIFSP